MKKIFALALTIFLLAPFSVGAAVTLGGLEKTAETANIASSPKTPEAITGKVLSTVISYVGVLFLCLILYAGFLWMTAAGNDEKIDKAKQIILAAVIGLIIVVAAYAITNFVGNSFINGTN